MSPVAFRLEAFSDLAHEPVEPERAEIEKAYQDGLSDGREAATDRQLDLLVSELRDLTTELQQDALRESSIREAEIASLIPLLDAILDALAPQAHSRRLEAALLEQIGRLSASRPGVSIRITCPVALQAMVQSCLQSVPKAQISLSAADGDGIEVEFDGGRINLSPSEIATQIRRIISETLFEESHGQDPAHDRDR